MGSKLIKKVNRQYRVGSPLLLLFSAPYIVWQIGVLYFCGTTMSLFGRTPVPLPVQNTAPIIAAGYAASILMICLFPRKTVWMERVVLPAALISTVAMLFPLPATTLTGLFDVAVFACVFSTGTMASVAAQHFTAETVWRDGLLSMVVGGPIIAMLQNDICKIDFRGFTLLSALLIAAQALFFYLIPARIEATYVSKSSKARMPKILFAGIWLISGFATLLICFASSFAESVPGGVSILYSSAAGTAVILYNLKRKLGSESIRVFGGFFAVSVFGFVLAFLSLHIPGLRVITCVLLGFVVVLAGLWIFFAATAFKIYPTRFIGAIGAAMGLALSVFHSILQNALRRDIPLLYGVYAALSVALLLVYFFMEPYFMRLWFQQKGPSPVSAAAPPEPSGTTAGKPKTGSRPFDVLSEQERILAELILDGHTETSAAGVMNISLNTQKSYRKNLYCKLEIHSKRELFLLAASASHKK